MARKGKRNTKQFRMACQILDELIEFQPFIYSTSASWHSIYIHFRKLPGGLTHKCRISDHSERSRYGYKWQIRTDTVDPAERKQWTRYFPDVEQLVIAFKNYYEKVENNMNNTDSNQYDAPVSRPEDEPEAWKRRKFPVDAPPDDQIGRDTPEFPVEDNPYSPVVKTIGAILILFLSAIYSLACPTTIDVHGRAVQDVTYRGIANVRISLIDGDQIARQMNTNVFGYYRFDGVSMCGQSYTVSAESRRFYFYNSLEALIWPIADDESDQVQIDFLGVPQ